MRRLFALSGFLVALTIAPALASAQPPAEQPPAQQPPAQQPRAQEQPEAPKVTFTSPAGMLLVQIKPDHTADFEEMASKLKAGLASATDPTLKQQAAGFHIYKAAEPFGTNALYIVFMEPAVPNAEYALFDLMQKTMTPEQLRAPETADMWKRYADAFAAGLSKLSLTPIGQ
jgi:hypothetical protein